MSSTASFRRTKIIFTLGAATLIGAVALLVLEEALPFVIRVAALPLFGDAATRISEYWQIVLGPLFLLVVLFARGGIDGLLAGARRGLR